MKTILVSRRQVLRGAGGFTLGLPFLASIATPRGALGQAMPVRRPRFVAFTTEHGGINGANMYPEPAQLTSSTELFAGHSAGHGPLVRKLAGPDAVLSPVLRAPAELLSERLVRKMNVVRGLDIPFYIAHHSGGHLGNYARNDGNGADGKMLQMSPIPTIDQVLGWSPSFYGDLAGIKERVLVAGTRGGLSWNWSNPMARTGTVQEVRPEVSSSTLFNRIFVPPATPGPEPRKPVVDRVMESYRRLRDGNRRLSTADRQRLDDHLARLGELERRLRVSSTRPPSCGGVARPGEDARSFFPSETDPVRARRKAQLYNEVIAAAFMCGTSRIAVHGIPEHFSSFVGDWHQDIAHKHTMPGPQQTLVDALRLAFQASILDLAARLDIEEGPGFTYLDNSLLQWSQESGQYTHDSPSIPVITFGGAGGFFNTGLFVDYRNQTPAGRLIYYGEFKEYTGLTYSRWLGTVLQAMGLPRSEYERDGQRGYGHPYVSAEYMKAYGPGVLASAGERLPVLTA
jgi:Protein of unknown function (DUF1552)